MWKKTLTMATCGFNLAFDGLFGDLSWLKMDKVSTVNSRYNIPFSLLRGILYRESIVPTKKEKTTFKRPTYVKVKRTSPNSLRLSSPPVPDE